MKIIAFIIAVIFFTYINLFAADFAIVEPEIIIDLPDEIVGSFMIFPLMRAIVILPENLFFISGELKSGGVWDSDAYGHIIEENDKYYLLTKASVWSEIFIKTEILINEDGFSFFAPELQPMEWHLQQRRNFRTSELENIFLYNAIRSRSLSLSEEAQKINLIKNESIRQYYIIQNEPEIIIPIENRFQLTIKNGMVNLRKISNYWYIQTRWNGYLIIDTINENEIIGYVVSEDYNFAYANLGISSIIISNEITRMIMHCNEIGFNINTPDDIEINYPITLIIEW